MKKLQSLHTIQSISELHRFLQLPRPRHPLISVFKFDEINNNELTMLDHFMLDFYCISIKKNFKGKLKYGQRYYDYDEGVMSFISPRQLLSHMQDDSPTQGISLIFHPEFLKGTSLGKDIKQFGFFSYELHEALHLSEQEEAVMESIMQHIEKEYMANIDQFSQGVMIAQIELLLQYSNRFYNRQFITRKPANDDLLVRLEYILNQYFDRDDLVKMGLPSVQIIAEQLHVSPNYLSDLLRSMTGQTTQQHIHNKVIEKAKELLATTTLSVSEIAYQLGFERPQSLNKLFKTKTQQTPLKYRHSFL